MRRELLYLLTICVSALLWASPRRLGAEPAVPDAKEQSVKKQSVKKQSVKKQSVKKQSVKKQSVKRQSVKRQSVKRQSAKKQSVKKQSVKKQRAKKQRAKKQRAKKQRAKKQRAKKQRANARKRRAKKSKRRRRPNSPEGWTWPPTKAMLAQGERCHKELTRLGLDWKKTKRRRNIATPVIVRSMDFGGLKVEPKFRKPPFVMDCHLAKSLAEAGPALVAMGVRALRFSSIHSYRKVRTGGKTKSMLSRHAYGLAVDIYEVDPIEGERLFVKEDYVVADEGNIDIPDRGAQLLRQLERESNASGQFRMLLTPANDPRSHYDHFHYEALVGPIDGAKGKKSRKRRKQKRPKQAMQSGQAPALRPKALALPED